MEPHSQSPSSAATRLFFVMPQQLSWWTWLVTAILLSFGLTGVPHCFVAAIVVSGIQLTVFLLREQSLSAFPVQLRLSYTLLLIVCLLPTMNWLFWLPTIGTFALNFFGYCLMARGLSLLPWNRQESITLELISRTFLSRPIMVEQDDEQKSKGCAGGVCSIEAQVRPKTQVLNASDLGTIAGR